jgi:hypothetical protein
LKTDAKYIIRKVNKAPKIKKGAGIGLLYAKTAMITMPINKTVGTTKSMTDIALSVDLPIDADWLEAFQTFPAVFVPSYNPFCQTFMIMNIETPNIKTKKVNVRTSKELPFLLLDKLIFFSSFPEIIFQSL